MRWGGSGLCLDLSLEGVVGRTGVLSRLALLDPLLLPYLFLVLMRFELFRALMLHLSLNTCLYLGDILCYFAISRTESTSWLVQYCTLASYSLPRMAKLPRYDR